jgi:hypothetical protein
MSDGAMIFNRWSKELFWMEENVTVFHSKRVLATESHLTLYSTSLQPRFPQVYLLQYCPSAPSVIMFYLMPNGVHPPKK